MKVWYASYGSNLLRERFMRYIVGGPIPGGRGVQRGCRDHTLPDGDEAIVFTRPIQFKGFSKRWGGGVAFLDCDSLGMRRTGGGQPRQGRESYGRMHRITLEQFWEVVEQENALEPAGVERLDLSILEVGMPRWIPEAGWYDKIVLLGEFNGDPVVTFTGGSDLDLNPPSESYLATILCGIHQTGTEDAIGLARYANGLVERSQAPHKPIELAMSCCRGAWSEKLANGSA
jgi:hypothetical protein